MAIRTRLGRLFRNNGFILALALVIGLGFGHGASFTRATVTPGLAVIMTLSLMGVSSTIFSDFRKLLVPTLLSVFLNYVVLSGAFVGLASLLLRDYELWIGFVLVAAVPPAVAVIPFTYHLGGNINYSLVGSVAAHLMAFVMAPFICTVFLGTNLLQPQQLLISLAELIAAPFIVSRILRLTRIAPWLEKYRGTIVNWGFFLVIYTIIGLNRGAFLEQPDALLRLSVVAFACTFAIAYVINRISKVLGAAKPNRISLAVLGAWKDYGLAGAIALTFFSSKAAMPAAVTTAFAILNFIWLTFWTKKSG